MDADTKGILEAYLSEGCCLILGSGVTSGFIGTWEELLNMLLAEHFMSKVPAIQSRETASADEAGGGKVDYTGFFKGASNTEVAEMLLADGIKPPPGYHGTVKEWHEVQFSNQVSRLIRKRLKNTLKKPCDKYSESCLMSPDSSNSSKVYTLGDMYGVCKHSLESAKCKEDICNFVLSHATAMAVVELCARRSIRFVVTYNFDTVVEEMLFDAITTGLTESDTNHIHIWTYGASADESILMEEGEYTLTYHQGCRAADFWSLAQEHAIHFIHVHGVADMGRLGKKSRLIFSDHSYQVYQDACLNWSNVMLHNLFSRHPAIGIGFSGIDANFRSLVDNLKNSSMREITSDTTNMVRIILIKAAQEYQTAIGSNGASVLPDDYVKECMKMSTDYYRSYYRIETHWEECYIDIAKTLLSLCMI